MNDDEHNGEFVSRMGKIERRAIPEAWKDEVFAAAFPEEPEPGRVVGWWLPPRWLGAGLAACWLGIAVLRMTAPVQPDVHVDHVDRTSVMDLSQRQQLLVLLEMER